MAKLLPASALTAASIVTLCTWLFAYFIHSHPIIGGVALFLTAIVIAFYIPGIRELLSVTGLLVFNRKVAWYCVLVISVGIALGIYLNITEHQPMVTLSLKITAITVALVGITEELLFRGFIQGMLSRYSTLLAIVGSTASHTIYKVIVIGSFPVNLGFNLFYLALFTFLVGLLAAWARHASKSILPTSLGHGFFDIVVYGSMAVPVWVWG